MERLKLKTAILIISDTAANDPSTDRSKDILSQTLASDDRTEWVLERAQIVRDDWLQIQNSVIAWCDQEPPINLIITTGGTGFAVKDRTPEAITPLLQRHAPGLV